MSESRGGWELTKENIQPLSSGRRMAYLAESLPVRSGGGLTDQLQYEAHHLEEIKKLEAVAEQKAGEDPLKAWVDVVKYFEQHFPNMSPTVHTKYMQVLKKAIQMFFSDEGYKKDKRYVELMIKSVSPAPPQFQIKLLGDFLANGHGRYVSDMYVKLAELYKMEGDTKKASEMLHSGIQNGAKPEQLLNEMLTHVQLSWAEGFAKRLQEGKSGAEQNDGQRNFASSVPIHGENNEAISIRQHLQPAAPTGSYRQGKTNDRWKETRQLVLHEAEEISSNSRGPTDSSYSIENVNPRDLQDLEGTVGNSENRLEASKWNGGDGHLNNPAIPEPPKLQYKLYAESDNLHTSVTSSSVNKPLPANKRVLKDRMLDEESTDPAPHSESISNQNDDSSALKKSKVDAIEIKPKFNLPSRFQPLAKPKRSYNPNQREDFFEDIKYKGLPGNGIPDFIALKEHLWRERTEKRRKEKMSEKNKLLELHKRVEELQLESNRNGEFSKKLGEQLRLADVKLMRKDEKIQSLEEETEVLTQQLTDLSTRSNMLESKYHREKSYLEQQVQELTELKNNLEAQLQECKAECAHLLQDKFNRERERQQMKDNESSEYEGIIIEKNSTLDRRPVIDIDVRNRNSDKYSTSSSVSAEQGSSEISRFNSGETTCAAANSFMPNEDDMSIVGLGKEYKNGQESLQDRKALVERPLENDMMNDTPASALPIDFEIPPPSFGFGAFRKPPSLALYESYSHEASLRKTSRGGSFNTGSRRLGASTTSSDQENMPQIRGISRLYSDENTVPPPAPVPAGQNTDTSSTNYQQEPTDENVERRGFLRPDIPSFKRPTFQSNENFQVGSNSVSTSVASIENGMKMSGFSNVSERLALLSSRPLNNYPSDDDDEDDMILRRHQQTGADLNMSNLTTALMLGPKPLTNSTPERERTLRNLRGLAPSEVPNVNAQLEYEEMAGQDYQGGINSRVSRYNSVLNDPPLNLSTIQETSRENRSRSTTGSSSGNTMSATRFGITGTTSTTPFFGNSTRSASIPRSANRVSQQQGNNNNGYYSDTNAK